MTAAGPRSDPPSNPFVRILMRQLASGFEDLRGADVSAAVPISERLLDELIQEALPRSSPVRGVHVAPQAGDRFIVRAVGVVARSHQTGLVTNYLLYVAVAVAMMARMILTRFPAH